MNRWTLIVAAALAAVVALPSSAAACSRDDKSYFDGFPDTSCLALPLTNTEIDTLGGLRLVTNGVPVALNWDTDVDFNSGVTYESIPYPPVGRSTLKVTGTGSAARLDLPQTAMPLTPSAAVLSPAAAEWLDNEGVSDPAVVKQASAYVMYYTGVAEDGSGPAIFRLQSNDGSTWVRPAAAADHDPVLVGTPGAFDAHGVFGPDVVYDPADTGAPWKMWYSGRGDVFDQIGYATSTDGITWTKFDGTDGDALPDVAVPVGLPGSRDSFAAAHPTVLQDGGLWKLWYEGDDSNLKSIAYATSTDGKVWSKAGAVITPEEGGNTEFGVFAPTVWKDGNTFEMLLAVRKEVGNPPTFQIKMQSADSTDGLVWEHFSVALNSGSWAASNLNSPEVLPEGNSIRFYYSGNRAGEGDPRDRIGYAPNTGGTPSANPALDLSPRSAAFDAREVSDLSVVDPAGIPDELAGVYSGLNEDVANPLARYPALGQARSATGQNWTKVAGPQADGSLIPRGQNNQFDRNGQTDPSLLYAQNGSTTLDYFLYFTGLSSTGVRTIGLSKTAEVATSLQPSPATWEDPGNTAFFGLGTAGQFDEAGVSHPSVIALSGVYVMYYTGTNAAGASRIGRAAMSAPASAPTGRAQVTLNAASNPTIGACDPDGHRDPVAFVLGGAVHLLYTGLESFDDGTAVRTIERTCWAQSTDAGGTTFDRKGVVLNPSQLSHEFDESGVTPASVLADANTLRVFDTGSDRYGRHRAGYASGSTTLVALPAQADAIPNGWATYQMGGPTTPDRDFQSITGTSTGAGVELWMSVLQPYSSDTKQYWSAYFPVDAANAEAALNFALGGEPGSDGGVSAVRWQARLRNPSGLPSLGKVAIGHAPIQFAGSGHATTTDITPPSEFTLKSWTSLTVLATLYDPLGAGGGATPPGGTITVLDGTGATVAGPSQLTIGGAGTTISLAGVDPATSPKLRVKLDLTSGTNQASPLVQSLKVDYVATSPTSPTLPPDTDGDGIADASDACPTVPGQSSAAGCPDADGDGVANAQDACPALAAPGRPDGCPDTDGDGVADPSDACPTVPAPGSPNGCPIAMTLVSSASKVVYGRSAVLSGTLLRGPLPLAGQIVTVFALRVGAAAPTALGTAVTDVSGKWALTVKPKVHTTYSVVFAGVASPAPVKVSVTHKLTLTVKLSGRRATFTGTLGPKHARRYVTIQRRSGTRWVKLTRVRTNRLSKFTYARSFRKGRHQFRAITGADRQHLAGRSSARRVTVR